MHVNGYNLRMTRGDSETIHISCENADGTPHPFQSGDTVYFTVKKDVNTAEILLQKIITIFTETGAAQVELAPQDTRGLSYGGYKYDVQLSCADGQVKTIVPPNDFRIGGEVTYD